MVDSDFRLDDSIEESGWADENHVERTCDSNSLQFSSSSQYLLDG